jgi:antirestriction protein
MNTATATRTAVYVGTYAKYNNGSIEGQWMNLEEYSDKETFIAACQELHKDEEDPELMFQDWEGIPEGMISECHIDQEVFAWLDLDEDERELLAAYRDNIDQTGTLEQAQEAFVGRASSKEDFAEEFFYSTMRIPKELENYIDWSRVVRDLECDHTFVYDGGEYIVFRDV